MSHEHANNRSKDSRQAFSNNNRVRRSCFTRLILVAFAQLRRNRLHRGLTACQLLLLLRDNRIADVLRVILRARPRIPPDQFPFAINHRLAIRFIVRIRHSECIAHLPRLIGDQVILEPILLDKLLLLGGWIGGHTEDSASDTFQNWRRRPQRNHLFGSSRSIGSRVEENHRPLTGTRVLNIDQLTILVYPGCLRNGCTNRGLRTRIRSSTTASKNSDQHHADD